VVAINEEEATTHTLRHICVNEEGIIAEWNGVQHHWRAIIDPAERRPSSLIEDGDRVFVHHGSGESLVQLVPRLPHPQTGEDEPGTLTAATPGTVVSVLVEEGQTVQAGQTLLVVEAMKMEQRLTSPTAGIVTALLVEEGETVSQGDTLLRMECEES
jgi:biotin carboxyl carrier protein